LKNKVLIIAIAAVVVLALAIGFGVFFLNNSSDYVAKVDGEKITVAEYKFFLANVKSSIEQAVGLSSSDASSVDKFWKGKLGTMNAEDYAKDQALGKVQEFKIELIKAKDEGVKLDQSDISSVDSYIDTIIKNNNGKESAEKAIKQDYGITLKQL
jgi:foldase protein PrsA